MMLDINVEELVKKEVRLQAGNIARELIKKELKAKDIRNYIADEVAKEVKYIISEEGIYANIDTHKVSELIVDKISKDIMWRIERDPEC